MKKTKVKKVKAWIEIKTPLYTVKRSGAVKDTYGQYNICTTKKYAERMSGFGYKVVPCEITYKI